MLIAYTVWLGNGYKKIELIKIHLVTHKVGRKNEAKKCQSVCSTQYYVMFAHNEEWNKIARGK